MSLTIKGRNELIVLNPTQFERVKKEFTRTGREYAGATQLLQEEISKLKSYIIEIKLKNQIELQYEQNEKEKYKTLVDTNNKIYELEKKNYELQIQLLTK